MNSITISPTEVRDKFLIRDGRGPCTILLDSGTVTMSLPYMDLILDDVSDELKLFIHSISTAAYLGYAGVKLDEDQNANTDIIPRIYFNNMSPSQEALQHLYENIDVSDARVEQTLPATIEEPIHLHFKTVTFKESGDIVYADVDCHILRLYMDTPEDS